MGPPPVGKPPRGATQISWLPFILLTLISFGMWFVTTFVVLLPTLMPGVGLRNDASADESAPSTGVAQAVAVIMLIIFQLFYALFVVATLRCVFTTPGDIPSWLRSDGKSDLHSYSNLLQAVERKRDGSPRFCRKTGAYKPDRAHYCHEVGRCVLQFQTFSPPLNSAIGFYNYKHYLLALLYGALCSAWVVSATLPEMLAASPLASMPEPAEGPTLRHEGLSARAFLSQLQTMGQSIMFRDSSSQWVVDSAILITFVLAVLALVPCAVTLALHTWLISNGRTMYEWRLVRAGKRTGQSQFDYGVINNFALTLGIFPLLWLLPTRSGIEGNGIFYPEQERVLFMH